MATFRQSVELTIPALRRYARALTRDADIADDLVQDTLVRALRSEHLFLGGDVRSWMYTILTNLNRNRLRSLARRPAMSSIEDNDAPDASSPESGARDIERARRLVRLHADQQNHAVAGGLDQRGNFIGPDPSIGLVENVEFDLDIVAEHAALGAFLGNGVNAGEGIRRDGGAEPADRVAVVAIMRGLDQHQAKAPFGSDGWGPHETLPQ